MLSQDGTDIADDTKITCNKDAVIKFSVSDADPSSGVSEIVVERENEGGSTESLGSFAPETDGSCVYTIAATSDNDGNSYTYKFTAYDNAGNASEVKTKKVSFFNDGTHTITREVLPAKDAENFVVWTDDTKIAIIDYKIDSEVDIDESKVTIALDEDANKWGLELRLYLHHKPDCIISTRNTVYRSEYSYRINDTNVISEMFDLGYRIGLNNAW